MPGRGGGLVTIQSDWTVAVLGAGPSGLYAAEALVKRGARVDVYERLFAPHGLVRYGVAPDHQKIKKTTAVFDRILSSPQVRFFGNVELGRDITVAELLHHYNQVVLATGSSGSRRLGIEGEDLRGSLSATELVGWYNGHPDFQNLDVPLDERTAVVVGVGNVAIDVARVLLQDRALLRETDITPNALAALEKSQVEEVHLLARRGPDQSAFDVKEVRELLKLPGVQVASLGPVSTGETPAGQLILELPRAQLTDRGRRIIFRFCVSPVALQGKDGRVRFVRLEENDLVESAAQLRAVGSGRFELLEAGLIVRAIGYAGTPLADVPFEAHSATIPNATGQVLDHPSGSPVSRLYTVGWIKRGPTGLIGTNRACAVETVVIMNEARLAKGGAPCPGGTQGDGVLKLLNEREVRTISWSDWQRLDQWEMDAGAEAGAVRRKVESIQQALEILGGHASRIRATDPTDASWVSEEKAGT